MVFKFENLEIWQEAIELGYLGHELTRKFPKEETFILTSQIKRAADSVALNIGEGSTGQTNAEFKQFLNYSMRSGGELISCLYIARKRSLVNKENFDELYSATEKLVKRIQSLKRSLR